MTTPQTPGSPSSAVGEREALKPCPFCGGNKALAVERTCERTTPYNAADRAAPIVRCMSCYAEAPGESWKGVDTAIASWNRRAAISAPAAEQGDPTEPRDDSDRTYTLPIGYLPAYELGRLHSGHDANLRSAKFGPSPLDGDVPVYIEAPAAEQQAAGMVMAPHFRGYAALGAGSYVLSPTVEAGTPCLVIHIATEADKANRKVGERRDTTEPGKLIQPENIAVRLDFLSERGLFALEDMLSDIRRDHFAATVVQAAEPQAGVPGDYPAMPQGADATMVCEDCEGRGEVGDEIYQGHFQPPERERCSSCEGSGRWKINAHSDDDMRAFADATDAHRAQQAGAGLGEPMAYMRRWKFDKVPEVKVKGRWPAEMKFHALTVARLRPDDVPLYTADALRAKVEPSDYEISLLAAEHLIVNVFSEDVETDSAVAFARALLALQGAKLAEPSGLPAKGGA